MYILILEYKVFSLSGKKHVASSYWKMRKKEIENAQSTQFVHLTTTKNILLLIFRIQVQHLHNYQQISFQNEVKENMIPYTNFPCAKR
jgi:hypothetical protein